MKKRALPIISIVLLIFGLFFSGTTMMGLKVIGEDGLVESDLLSYESVYGEFGDTSITEAEWKESLEALDDVLGGFRILVNIAFFTTLAAIVLTLIAVVKNDSSTNILYLIAGILVLYNLIPAILNIVQFFKKPIEEFE